MRPMWLPVWPAILLLAVALLWPALANGPVPLLFPDSIDYLTNGRDGYLGVTRPPGYAYAILPLWRPLGLPSGLWAVVAAQALLHAWLIWLTFAVALGRRASIAAWSMLLAAPLLCLASSLPFLASWVMADALSAPTLLAAALLAVGWTRLRPSEKAGLLLLTLVGAAAHQTHAVMVATAVLAVLGLSTLRARSWVAQSRVARRGALAALAAAVLAVTGLLALNRGVHGHADTAQAGPTFLLARLVGDGLVAPHAAALCAGREAVPICRRADWLADRKVDELLWEPASPLWVDYHGFEAMRPDAQALVWGTVRLEWRTVLRNGLGRAARLLVSMRLPELDLRPMAEPLMSGLAHQLPELLVPVGASLQLSGALAAGVVPRIAPWAMLASLGALVGIMHLLLRRGQATGVLGMAVLAGMAANALVVGLTAEAYDRYQARLGWLPMLVLLAVVLRATRRRAAHSRAKRRLGTADGAGPLPSRRAGAGGAADRAEIAFASATSSPSDSTIVSSLPSERRAASRALLPGACQRQTTTDASGIRRWMRRSR